MQLLLPLLAIGIVTIIGLFSSKKIITLKKHIQETPAPTITRTVSESPSLTTTIKITQTTKPAATDADFIYPGSQSNGNNEYISQDNPNVITDWYKDKIKSGGYNTKSFVTTKANDNINNVLAGANGNSEIKVTIIRNSGDTITHIKIAH